MLLTRTSDASSIERYFTTLSNVLATITASDANGRAIEIPAATEWVVHRVASLKQQQNKVIFVGNGGSAGISSHMAIDYLKNGGVPALAFNDAASLTCLANDLGYENVFATQIEMHGNAGDLLIAISSSGCSKNILTAVQAAMRRQMEVVTLSGFRSDNPLRRLGKINFYVESGEYGFVEISHLALCHAFLDIKMGWQQSP